LNPAHARGPSLASGRLYGFTLENSRQGVPALRATRAGVAGLVSSRPHRVCGPHCDQLAAATTFPLKYTDPDGKIWIARYARNDKEDPKTGKLAESWDLHFKWIEGSSVPPDWARAHWFPLPDGVIVGPLTDASDPDLKEFAGQYVRLWDRGDFGEVESQGYIPATQTAPKYGPITSLLLGAFGSASGIYDALNYWLRGDAPADHVIFDHAQYSNPGWYRAGEIGADLAPLAGSAARKVIRIGAKAVARATEKAVVRATEKTVAKAVEETVEDGVPMLRSTDDAVDVLSNLDELTEAQEALRRAGNAQRNAILAGLDGQVVGMAEQVRPTASSFEQARSAALRALGDIDPATRTPVVGRLGSGEGRVVGFETRVGGVWKRFRLDYDPAKGPHINIEIGRPAGIRIAFPWRGTLEDFLRQVRIYGR
jgi:hypothetical protein